MGTVEEAKRLVSALMKKSDTRAQELQSTKKKIENMRDQLSSTFQGTASDTERKVASALDESINRFDEAVKSVAQSKEELAKCQRSL